MSLFTTTDRDNVKSALITAAVDGVASVSVAGQSVQVYTLQQLKDLLAFIQDDLAAANTESLGGLRMRVTKPPVPG